MGIQARACRDTRLPVGCTGSRIMTTLLYEMKRRNVKRGLGTLCAGGGMGTAMVVERP
jgi:acetyl-CoA C-acetyltransferase